MKRLWTLHLGSLAALCLWGVSDPLLDKLVRAHSFDHAAAYVGWFRVAVFVLIASVAVASLLALLIRMFSKRTKKQQRTLIQLFAITTMVAVWCSLAIHRDWIVWQGKRVRFAFRVAELEVMVAPLRHQWPDTDGDLPRIGPFMAYPFGRPTTLVLLQAPRVSGQSVYVSAVERCASGAIKLQLTGADGDAWAEWHPPGSQPESFTGGLDDRYELCSASPISDGWFLVRYAS